MAVFDDDPAMPFADLAGKNWRLQNYLTDNSSVWNGDELQTHGLLVDLAPWQAAVLKAEVCLQPTGSSRKSTSFYGQPPEKRQSATGSDLA